MQDEGPGEGPCLSVGGRDEGRGQGGPTDDMGWWRSTKHYIFSHLEHSRIVSNESLSELENPPSCESLASLTCQDLCSRASELRGDKVGQGGW